MVRPILVVDPDSKRLDRLAAELRRKLKRPVVAAINRESALAFCSACRPCAVVIGEDASGEGPAFEREMERIFGSDARPVVASFSC